MCLTMLGCWARKATRVGVSCLYLLMNLGKWVSGKVRNSRAVKGKLIKDSSVVKLAWGPGVPAINFKNESADGCLSFSRYLFSATYSVISLGLCSLHALKKRNSILFFLCLVIFYLFRIYCFSNFIFLSLTVLKA